MIFRDFSKISEIFNEFKKHHWESSWNFREFPENLPNSQKSPKVPTWPGFAEKGAGDLLPDGYALTEIRVSFWENLKF
jgi:hypothetical protein